MVLMFYLFFLFMAFNLRSSLAHQLLHDPFLMFYCMVLNKKRKAKVKGVIPYLFGTFGYFLVTDKWNFFCLWERQVSISYSWMDNQSLFLNPVHLFWIFMQKCLKILLLTDLFEFCKCNARNLFSHIKSGIVVQTVTLVFWGMKWWKFIWIGHGINFWIVPLFLWECFIYQIFQSPSLILGKNITSLQRGFSNPTQNLASSVKSCGWLVGALTYPCLHRKDCWFSLISYVIDQQQPLNAGCRKSRIKLFEFWVLSLLVFKVIVAYDCLQIIYSLLAHLLYMDFFFH